MLDSLFGVAVPDVKIAQIFVYISTLVPTPSGLHSLMTDVNTNVPLTFAPYQWMAYSRGPYQVGKFSVQQIMFNVNSDAAQS